MRVQRYNRFASEVLFFYICQYLKSDKYKNHNKPNQKKKSIVDYDEKIQIVTYSRFCIISFLFRK